MQDLVTLQTLIDKGKEVVGSDYKLAKAIGTTPARLSGWRNGHQTCPVADMALLAHVAGLDPVAELARAVVAKHEGTPKGDKLMRALGKALPAIGAAIGSAGASAAEISSSGKQLLDTMYIIVKWFRHRTSVFIPTRKPGNSGLFYLKWR
jgi:hypothetical protein